MTHKELATRLQNQQIGFENILFELKSILETYLDKLNEDDHPEPEYVTNTVRLLAQTVQLKNEQMIALNAEIGTYRYIVNNPLCTTEENHAE